MVFFWWEEITTDSGYLYVQIGLISGISLSIILFLGFGAFSGLFSADAEVLEIARSGLWVRTRYLNNRLLTFYLSCDCLTIFTMEMFG